MHVCAQQEAFQQLSLLVASAAALWQPIPLSPDPVHTVAALVIAFDLGGGVQAWPLLTCLVLLLMCKIKSRAVIFSLFYPNLRRTFVCDALGEQNSVFFCSAFAKVGIKILGQS